jgi:hypothetical protein
VDQSRFKGAAKRRSGQGGAGAGIAGGDHHAVELDRDGATSGPGKARICRVVVDASGQRKE